MSEPDEGVESGAEEVEAIIRMADREDPNERFDVACILEYRASPNGSVSNINNSLSVRSGTQLQTKILNSIFYTMFSWNFCADGAAIRHRTIRGSQSTNYSVDVRSAWPNSTTFG